MRIDVYSSFSFLSTKRSEEINHRNRFFHPRFIYYFFFVFKNIGWLVILMLLISFCYTLFYHIGMDLQMAKIQFKLLHQYGLNSFKPNRINRPNDPTNHIKPSDWKIINENLIRKRKKVIFYSLHFIVFYTQHSQMKKESCSRQTDKRCCCSLLLHIFFICFRWIEVLVLWVQPVDDLNENTKLCAIV